ncbi:hypothetical protein L9F63_010769, partial [Diploptera punctata]
CLALSSFMSERRQIFCCKQSLSNMLSDHCPLYLLSMTARLSHSHKKQRNLLTVLKTKFIFSYSINSITRTIDKFIHRVFTFPDGRE